ncbi:MAG: hypothetical protein ABWX68_03215 [Arthrobacter sp.]|uniref:hypothetical protein n=1 Tax=Arthrobacter sp. TaxID=1667 RepID=UPI003473DE11
MALHPVEAAPVPARHVTLDTAWMARLSDVDAFVRDTGRLPGGATGNPAERRLFRWLENQLRRQRAGGMSASEDQILRSTLSDLFPAPRRARSWESMAREIEEFAREYRRLPRASGPGTPGEKRLAAWMGAQACSRGNGSLSTRQEWVLDQLLRHRADDRVRSHRAAPVAEAPAP